MKNISNKSRGTRKGPPNGGGGGGNGGGAISLFAHARFPIILVKYLVYNDAVITYAVNVIFTI